MRYLKSPLLLLCIGFILGIVAAETAYYFYSPLVLPDGAVAVVTNRDYFPRASEAISRARESIHMVMFSLNYQTDPQYRDSDVNKLLQQLVSARNRGIDVGVVMDDWPEGNNRTMKYLEDNNIPVVMTHFDGSTHAKLIVIDGRIVIVGSTNWSYHSLDKNNEANVIVNDVGVAKRFEEYFSLLEAS